jgi:PIN domain nuclease of toxin-antitoxin system
MIRFLLDSHIALWYLYTPSQLSPTWIEAINQADECLISFATIWELSIKAKKGKLDFIASDFIVAAEQSGFDWLDIQRQHILKVHDLPLFHNDPFDRLLVAQAMADGLTLVTADKRLALYSSAVQLVV